MIDALSVIKWAIYLWAIFELGLSASLCWLSYKKGGKSKILGALATQQTALAIMELFRLAMSYSLIITKSSHALARDLIIIPLLFVPITTHAFIKMSLKLDVLNLETK